MITAYLDDNIKPAPVADLTPEKKEELNKTVGVKPAAPDTTPSPADQAAADDLEQKRADGDPANNATDAGTAADKVVAKKGK